MLGPFSINTYLPSFGEMAVVLGTDRVALQQTVAIYFAAFAFMALWHGTISDSCRRASKTTQRCALNFTQAL